MSNLKIQENIARASDLLEQINKLNEMVEFHRVEDELSMMRQYELMRKDFLDELEEILVEFKINVKINGIAA